MQAVGENVDIEVVPIHVDTETCFEAITDYYLPALEEQGIPYGKSAILAPWWFTLFPLARQLREYGIPIVGPGARPYKRSHLFATIAEKICAYLVMNNQSVFHQLEKELFLLLNNLTGMSPFPIYSFEGRLLARQLVRIGKEFRDMEQGGIAWLMGASSGIADVLQENEFLSVEAANLFRQSADNMIADMQRNHVDINNLTVDDLGMYADTANSMKLLTMHKAKGREFDAVAIVDIHDGKVPDYRAIRDNDVQRIEEGRRLFYVGITRARKLLMYATDHEDSRYPPSRFLGDNGLALL